VQEETQEIAEATPLGPDALLQMAMTRMAQREDADPLQLALVAMMQKLATTTESQGAALQDLLRRGSTTSPHSQGEDTDQVPGTRKRVPKPFSVPKLGEGKDAVGYISWVPQVKAVVAANGAQDILETDPPLDAKSPEGIWYHDSDAVVFAALLRSTEGVSLLSGQIAALQGERGASRKAWEKIRGHYIVVSQFTSLELRDELAQFKLAPQESMTSLLERLAKFQGKCNAYGVQLEEADLVERVFKLLPRDWAKAIAHNFPPRSSVLTWDWPTVCQALKAEDVERRHAAEPTTEADLPLGWYFKYQNNQKILVKEPEKGKARAAQAEHSSQQGKGKSGAKHPKNRSGPKQYSGPLVCYYCKQVGHSLKKCPTLPKGWTLTAEDKAEAEKIASQQKKGSKNSGQKGQANEAVAKSDPQGETGRAPSA
jgi:hypothetical protein